MHKALALTLVAPLILIGAAYPDGDKIEAVDMDETEEMTSAPVTYRPCRPGPGDDRCIQLYERGVRASYARWLRDRRSYEDRDELAMGGPVETPAYRPRVETRQPPREQHASRDHRCVESGYHAPGHHDDEPPRSAPLPDVYEDDEQDGETRGM